MLERIYPFAIALVQLLLQLCHTIAQAGGQFIILFLGGLCLMPFEHGDFGLQFLDIGRHGHMGQTLPATCLVKGIKSLVGQGAVGDILGGQAHTGFNGFGLVFHGVVLLVTGHHFVQNIQRLGGRRRLYQNLLEATL